MIIKGWAVLSATVLLTAIWATTSVASNRKDVERAVRGKLREPDSARFIQVELRSRPNARGEIIEVACGSVIARNGVGGVSPAVPFVFFDKDKSVMFARRGVSIDDDDGLDMGATVYSNFCR